MGYAEARLQREVQQLRREVKKARDRERQTRKGCMDLAGALGEIVSGLEGSSDPAAERATALVDQAMGLLAPDPNASA